MRYGKYLGLSRALCGRAGTALLPSGVPGPGLLTLSEEPLLPPLEVPGEAFESGVMDAFARLVLVLAPSWMVVEIENDSLRNVVEPLRAFVLAASVSALWLCLRGLLPLLGAVWGDEEVAEALALMVILPCNAAQESTEVNESFLCGWRTPSVLCLGSLASLDMAEAESEKEGEEKEKAV